MPRWIRSYWDEEDVTFVWEVADDGWIQRSVEQVGPERNPRSAAALAEVIAARDAGGISAVQAYESSHGLLPDQLIDDWASLTRTSPSPSLSATGMLPVPPLAVEPTPATHESHKPSSRPRRASHVTAG